jgi:hypothetical protein
MQRKLFKKSLARDGVQLLCCGKNLKLAKDPLESVCKPGRTARATIWSLTNCWLPLAVRPMWKDWGWKQSASNTTRKASGSTTVRRRPIRAFTPAGTFARLTSSHTANFMARVVIQNALFLGRVKASSLIIPWSTYTSPEIAHVGLYEKDAQAKVIKLDKFSQELGQVDRAILDGETEGFVHVHVCKGTDEIVGGDRRRRARG